MRPTSNAFFAPAADPGQSYRAAAAEGRIIDTLTDIETGLSELLSMQNAALSRIDHLIAQSGTRTVTRAASADNAQSSQRVEALRSDITRCRSCGNLETISTQL
ncbi:hypothetical protein PCO31111_01384 [Pandoraea communis]|uniref:Uncharacterized protein n=1 Tax=Pandoraea communis TaxID=2508297 RepID=A0A5E4SVT6_9BURK|nr:hypothetical protein [Pandoraea communis]VVD79162.1 hypothetical protein PCO31110_01036 [Pandoraea communis]VVD86145.1 hypothetical protein PCO31111_01384 [Pandoraea communis]